MEANNTPLRIPVPWANVGDKVVVPVPSQVAVTDGRASWTTGFVPLNATPLSAGGVAPFETDFNGVLNQMSAVQQWQCAGGLFKYDADFSAAVGGYPAGARLAASSPSREWVSRIDNNTANPETASANWSMRSQNGFSSYTPLTASRTLISRDMGQVLSSQSSYTLTLPTPTSLNLAPGEAVTVFGNIAGATTVVAGAGVQLNFDATSIPSITVKSGQSAKFVVVGAGIWQIVESTAGMGRNVDFAGTLATSAKQVLPSGWIIQKGQLSITTANLLTRFTFDTPFPTSGVSTVICVSAISNSGAVISTSHASALASGAGVDISATAPCVVDVIAIGW